MKKLSLILPICVLSGIIQAQTKLIYFPYLQSGGMYYSSKQITSAGAGPGIGLLVGMNEHFLLKSDLNLFWVNGNASSLRLALGYKRAGLWSPAVCLGVTSIFGSRTELLLEDGSRPIYPSFSAGLQICPLRFENPKGFVSLLETGYGLGSYRGKNYEVSVLSIGIKI